MELGKGHELSPLYIVSNTVSKLFTHLWELLVVGLVLRQHCLAFQVQTPFFSGILALQLPVCLYLIFRGDLYLSTQKSTRMEHTEDPALIATLSEFSQPIPKISYS